MEFISKEDKYNIEMVNQSLGMCHRTNPYDFKNSFDIIEATTMVTAEYVDYACYYYELSNILENFDESLEYYNASAWLKLGLKGTTDNKLLDKSYKSLRKTEEVFYELMNYAEEKCLNMWNLVFFNAPKEVARHFFGKNIKYDEKVIKSVLDNFSEIVTEINYKYNIEDSTKAFVRELKAKLKEKAESI
ncbi:MAG: hypothetical protein ACM3KR_10350 [Deltaproteobacteria bacterium]